MNWEYKISCTDTKANYFWVHLEWDGYRVHHVMELSLILFNIFINHLEDEKNNTLIKSSGGTNSESIVRNVNNIKRLGLKGGRTKH